MRRDGARDGADGRPAVEEHRVPVLQQPNAGDARSPPWPPCSRPGGRRTRARPSAAGQARRRGCASAALGTGGPLRSLRIVGSVTPNCSPARRCGRARGRTPTRRSAPAARQRTPDSRRRGLRPFRRTLPARSSLSDSCWFRFASRTGRVRGLGGAARRRAAAPTRPAAFPRRARRSGTQAGGTCGCSAGAVRRCEPDRRSTRPPCRRARRRPAITLGSTTGVTCAETDTDPLAELGERAAREPVAVEREGRDRSARRCARDRRRPGEQVPCAFGLGPRPRRVRSGRGPSRWRKPRGTRAHRIHKHARPRRPARDRTRRRGRSRRRSASPPMTIPPPIPVPTVAIARQRSSLPAPCAYSPQTAASAVVLDRPRGGRAAREGRRGTGGRASRRGSSPGGRDRGPRTGRRRSRRRRPRPRRPGRSATCRSRSTSSAIASSASS